VKTIVAVTLAATALALAGCSTLEKPIANSQKSAIESVMGQRAKLEKDQIGSLSAEHVRGLMAIDVQGCPADFRSAWFDYLVEAQNLHRRAERVAGIASAVDKPVSDLPSLIRFAAATPELGKYLLAALDKLDSAWGKVERAGMNYGVIFEYPLR
jgi:hypothetical protein